LPFESAETLLKVAPYRVQLKGKVILTTTLSPWLPVSVVPGTIMAPVDWVM
jgi:hypothetical protein